MKLKQFFAATAALSMLFNSAQAIAANTQTAKTYQASGSANAQKMVKEAFNKLRYKLTVEWDQENPYFKERAQDQFAQDLKELVNSGVTLEQVQRHMETALLSEQAKKEYNSLLETLKAQGATPAESASAAARFMEDTYMTGASFAGSAGPSYRKIAVILGVIAVAVVTYHLVHDDDDDDDNGSEETVEEECPEYCYEEPCYSNEYPRLD